MQWMCITGLKYAMWYFHGNEHFYSYVNWLEKSDPEVPGRLREIESKFRECAENVMKYSHFCMRHERLVESFACPKLENKRKAEYFRLVHEQWVWWRQMAFQTFVFHQQPSHICPHASSRVVTQHMRWPLYHSKRFINRNSNKYTSKMNNKSFFNKKSPEGKIEVMF